MQEENDGDRPPAYQGRDDLETRLSSSDYIDYTDFVKISSDATAIPSPAPAQPDFEVDSSPRPNKGQRTLSSSNAEAAPPPNPEAGSSSRSDDMAIDAYIASLPIDEVEKQLRAMKSGTSNGTVLDDLQRGDEKSCYVLNPFLKQTRRNSVTAMLVWRYLQERQLWLTHPNGNLRSREAFVRAFEEIPGFHGIIKTGAVVHWSQKLRSDSVIDIADDDPVAVLEGTDTQAQSAAPAQDLVNNDQSSIIGTNDLATDVDPVVTCLIFMPDVQFETVLNSFCKVRAIRINPVVPRRVSMLCQPQHTALWWPLSVFPDLDRKLTRHYDRLLAKGACHLDYCGIPIITNSAEDNPGKYDAPVIHVFDNSRDPVFRFVTGTTNSLPHGTCCDAVRSIFHAIANSLDPHGPQLSISTLPPTSCAICAAALIAFSDAFQRVGTRLCEPYRASHLLETYCCQAVRNWMRGLACWFLEQSQPLEMGPLIFGEQCNRYGREIRYFRERLTSEMLWPDGA